MVGKCDQTEGRQPVKSSQTEQMQVPGFLTPGQCSYRYHLPNPMRIKEPISMMAVWRVSV